MVAPRRIDAWPGDVRIGGSESGCDTPATGDEVIPLDDVSCDAKAARRC